MGVDTPSWTTLRLAKKAGFDHASSNQQGADDLEANLTFTHNKTRKDVFSLLVDQEFVQRCPIRFRLDVCAASGLVARRFRRLLMS